MAAPHVAGVAALILSAYPNATTPQIKWAILEGVDYVRGLDNLAITGGRLNARGALSAMDSAIMNNAFHGIRYGIHHIRNASTNRYLTRMSSQVSLETYGYVADQKWVVQRVGSEYEVRTFNPAAGNIGRMSVGPGNNTPAGITTGTTNTTIRVVQNANDGTVTFRLGTASNALTLTASGNVAVWATHTGNTNQRWHLEAHRLTHQRGDVNQDGRINATDVTNARNIMNNPASATAVQFFLADVDRDGRVTQTDINRIQAMI
jgi:subtilisin family serine protease